ncbi:MAG: hypothetical protein QOE45_1130 [Frankiaceae bacterium]|nr:hypothetical protein [Frankiaceae bacterium]
MTRHRRAAAALLAVVLVASCSHGKKPQPNALPTNGVPSVTPTASAKPKPTPTKVGLLSPFTGLPIDRLRPVLAIKIDNAVLARPQRGLDEADIVYEEAVEGRTTRFLAIFSSRSSNDIGPVRSVRESDLPLLRMYGRVAFGFSGGNTGVVAIVRQNPVINVSYDNNPRAYTIAGRRRDAYNFITSTSRLLALAPQSALASDIGLRFGALPPKGAVGATSISVVWSRFAHTSWKWDPAHRVYLRSMDGRPAMLRNGHQQSSPNVLIQYVRVRNSHFSDVHGAPSPYTTTTGTGNATLMRDGRAINGTWRRDGLGKTHFIDRSTGKDMLLHAGPVWVMLVPNDTRATIT